MAAPDCQTCGLVVYHREHGDRTPRSEQVTGVYRKNPPRGQPPPEHWRAAGVARALRMRDAHGNSALKLDSNVAFASAIGTSVVAGLLIFGAEAKRLRR